MTLKKILDPKDTICRDLWAYPVIELTRPRIRTCCKRQGKVITPNELETLRTDVFLNLPETLEERLQMMSGVQIEKCSTCWKLENDGLQSFRLGHLDFQFQFNNDNGSPVHYTRFKPFEKIIEEKDNYLRSNMPNKLDISLGTYCDQKCVYCNEDYSTQWETENKKFGKITSGINSYKKIPINDQTINGYYETFLDWFDSIYEHLERISLFGGEPTSSPLFESLSNNLIQKLKIKNHPNCEISIVTNLNWKKPILNQIIKIKNELPNIPLVLEVSMESTGKKAEYIRDGVNWERFCDNFNKISSIQGIEIRPIITINALCISSLLNYLKYLKKVEAACNKDFKIIANRLVKPMWLSMRILDSRHHFYLEEIINWLEDNYIDINNSNKKEFYITIKNILKELNLPRDDRLLGYFVFWINTIDSRRNQNFSVTFPEFKSLVDEGNKFILPNYNYEEWEKWAA